MTRLSGKVALISGAGAGIGRATARRFVSEGARVVATDIDLVAAEETVANLGDHAVAAQLDIRDAAQWEAAIRLATTGFGKLDIVCNIAGIALPGSIEDIAIADWDAMLSVNMTGTLLGCQLGLRGILASGGRGAIINMSSAAGLVGLSDMLGYTATKGGVTLLTKAIAVHCAAKGYPVRCVAIHPTYVDTPLLDGAAVAAGGRANLLAAMAKLVPIGRICTADEVAAAIVFAASDEAGMLTGSGIVLDGAQLAGPPAVHSGA